MTPVDVLTGLLFWGSIGTVAAIFVTVAAAAVHRVWKAITGAGE